MPKDPIDYSKTIIYKIVCKDLSKTDIYVGHTTDFRTRKSQHKSNCNNEKSRGYNLKVYNFIRENGGWENFSMVQIEEYNCNNKREAESRERYWYEELNAKLNSICPIRTQKEYYEVNKEYYENNIEKIKEYKKEWREQNIEKIKEYHKEYREQNKEKIKEKDKEWYEENKEKIIEKVKDYYNKRINKEYICFCGWIGNYVSKNKHLRISKQHKDI